MKTVKEVAPVVCDICGKVFYAKYAFICPKCRKEINRERAKSIGLNKLGNAFGCAFEDRAKSTPITRPPQSWCYVESDAAE